MKNQAAELKKKCEPVAGLLKILSHPQRLAILCVLAVGEKSAGELESACGASQPAVSQFLKEMRLEGLVASRRDGKFVYYRIGDGRAKALIKALHRIFC